MPIDTSHYKKIISFIKECIQELRKANPFNADFNGQCSTAIFWLEDQEKNVWIDPKEELPTELGKHVLLDYGKDEHDVAFWCKDDNYFLAGFCRIWPQEVKRWAYLNDLIVNLTNDKKPIISFIKECIQELRKAISYDADFNEQCSDAIFWLEDQEKNIWHNAKKELPTELNKPVLIAYAKDDYDVAFYWKSYNYFLYCGCCRVWPHEVKRWAYLEDLLKNK